MTKKQKKNLIRIIVALTLFIIVFIVDKVVVLSTVINDNLGWLLPFFLYLTIYIIIGYDVIIKAFKNIKNGQIFDECFLMLVATIGAFSLAIYRGVNKEEIEGFDEACAVLLFYQIGEFFQNYAVSRSRKSIASLMDIRPDYANVYVGNEVNTVDPESVNLDDIIVVYPGEKVPLDGIVIKGETSLDTKSLTGESKPSIVKINDCVISGTINLTSTIEVKVTKEFYNSTVSKVLELVENASSKKAKTEQFITKFAKYYTPIVVMLALILAIVPSLITGAWNDWIYRSLSFLVVSCPCALVISIPLTFFSGIGIASKKGILIKGSNYLEQFSNAKTFVFDKTGTLTKGNFVITKVYPENKREEILKLAATAEHDLSHPIAKSICNEYKGKFSKDYVMTDLQGLGIVAKKGNDTIYCGNEKLMKKYHIGFEKANENGTIVYVAKNDEYIGTIIINDEIKNESFNLIKYLQSTNTEVLMLTGDNESSAKQIAEELNIKNYKSSLLPQDKYELLTNLISNSKKPVCFVGDGINDAPSLMISDVGISMGGIGSDAAIEASDIVLMQDDLNNIIEAKKISQKTMRIVKENIIFAISVKVIILVLSAFGFANMWIAVFGDVGVTLLAILNSLRLFKYKSKIESKKSK
ncbi:MAG: cadmium-translocating P-type ATPase [Erysipelotrichales bacterium]|nr:cadmium-translocating P-type ATPase [Erysipelotrichales bacterium]